VPTAPPRKLLIVSASIGGGHTAAARALEEAARERDLEVEHVDMLDYTTQAFRRVYRQVYFDLVRTAPNFVDWLGRRLDRLPMQQTASRQMRIMLRLTRGLTRLVSYRLPRHVHASGPDAVVHTHFLPPQILGTSGRRLPVPQAEVVTDFYTHRLWLQPDLERYFVASEEVAAHMRAMGVPEEALEVSGIPIDLRYCALSGREEARERLALPPSRDLLLVMAGGLDDTTLRELLRGLKALRRPLQVVVICGRSQAFVNVAQGELEDHEGPSRFVVVGFTTDVQLYMAAADLLLGKPGGLTASEALAAGLPFAIVQPYPLQEEANANHLLECGAGMRIEPIAILEHKLKGYFDDATKQEAMRRAAKACGRPEAARRVLESLLLRPL
jgi:processive 1,2-diacylglycerol beta-glucosyltransferase